VDYLGVESLSSCFCSAWSWELGVRVMVCIEFLWDSFSNGEGLLSSKLRVDIALHGEIFVEHGKCTVLRAK
jgi:hypothetical protein